MPTITMPALGESVTQGEVGKWLVREGEAVRKDQPLVEILTDKADSEVVASEAGVVSRILAQEGAVVAVGAPLCELGPSAARGEAPGVRQDAAPQAEGAVQASPAVRRLAREAGVDVRRLAGTGLGGRVTREDVVAATAIAPTSAADHAPAAPPQAFKTPPYVPRDGDEVVPFTRRRRIIADHMVYSVRTSPHVVTLAECDLHATAQLRARTKDDLRRQGVNLTYLAFVAAATCRALREFRVLNARVLEDAYVLLREIHLGIAVDTPEGLVVPVVRNADELSVRGLARAIDEVAVKARDGRLLPDDLAGKTFTLSNPGRKGNLVGGAIISQPNVGILRLGEIKKRVVVVERDDEDLLAIHPVMHMALSYDHRIVDGVEANAFLWRITELLERADFEL